MSVFSLVFLFVFFAFIAKSDEKSPDFSTIQTLFDLDVKCFQEIDEKFCHKKYLNSFDGIPPEIGANQESEKYKQLVIPVHCLPIPKRPLIAGLLQYLALFRLRFGRRLENMSFL
jgi:hypothetical protein